MDTDNFIDAMALRCCRCGETFRGDEIFTNKHKCGKYMREKLLEGIFHNNPPKPYDRKPK